MKRFLVTVLLVVAAAVFGVWAITSSPAESPTSSDTQTASPTAAPEVISTPANGQAMTVTHVHDGDTLFLLSADGEKLKVRLIGIDTPELQPVAECYADEAAERLRQLTPDGSTVTVAADREPLDRYGRSLLYPWNEAGTFVNLELVTDGYAGALNIAPNSRYSTQFSTAEGNAQASAAGRWGAC